MYSSIETWVRHFSFPINKITQLHGGDVNESYCLNTKTGNYFLKRQANTTADFFLQERLGLETLGRFIRTPEIIESGEFERYSYLLLEWIHAGPEDDERLGKQIAYLHQQKDEKFGFSANASSHSLAQSNQLSEDWLTFFFEQKMQVKIDSIIKKNHWSKYRQQHYQKLERNFVRKWENRTVVASLLHGDLWRGNVMFGLNSEVILIDPAVYYGDREMDIAMTQLFGGFNPSFLAAYQKAYPLDTGWQERMPVYQLYYLLAHLDLFGETYGPAVDRILSQWN